MARLKRTGAWIVILLLVSLQPGLVNAQVQQDCGIVDAIDYPIDSISIDHDDFGMYRATFNGYHTGIDMAFERYGEPIRAAAKGRITFSDPQGWDTEKGVVVIEHTFPDHSTYFSLYGHMEQVNGHTFPRVGDCVAKGDIVGAEGRPNLSAPHLHYEIRKMRASTGGPGYWSVDPLDGGWMHPIEFTEQWRLRFNPAFRKIITASAAPIGQSIWLPDGSVAFGASYQLETRSAGNDLLWELSLKGLTGLVGLPDGRLLGLTLQNQVIIFENGRFVSSWQMDRPLRSGSLRLGDSVVFLTQDNRVVSYGPDGALRWQTDPINAYIERYVLSGNLLALSTEQDGTYQLWVIDQDGKIVYQGTAPAPVIPVSAQAGGFIIMVAAQVSLLGPDLNLRPLIDAGQPLARNSQAAVDKAGNIYLYPGHGQDLYAYAPDGTQRWQTHLPAPSMQPPLLAVGAGCLVYALTSDGALLAYRALDGSLRGIATLYAGGPHNTPAARFLETLPDEQVRFSAGYLSTATIDGPTLANMDKCAG